MDPLEEQLAKLSLLNSRPLPQRGGYAAAQPETTESSSVLAKKNVFEGGEELRADRLRVISPKKVGPLVPPKPHKKHDHFPEIPQSSLVKQICEPLYSQRLQCLDSSINSPLKLGRPPILQRKQPLYASQGGLYSKTSKVTLDNPAILDQQLEALAHHKKQLEKKRLLLEKQQQQSHSTQSLQAQLPCIPKLSSTSLVSEARSNDGGSTNVYTNLHKHSANGSGGIGAIGVLGGGTGGNVFQKVSAFEEKQPSNQIYSNLMYDKECIENMQNHHHQSASASSSSPSSVFGSRDLHGNANVAAVPNAEYMGMNDELSLSQQDDELPPPPSPVSSSYSELRRAADVFVKKNATIDGDYAPCHLGKTNAELLLGGDKHKNATASANANRHYINVNYNNDYSNYSPTLQSISQDSTDYYGYGSFSQGSSTYESIYEPINPRPPSQSSLRSNYMIGGAGGGAGGGSMVNAASGGYGCANYPSTGNSTPIYPSADPGLDVATVNGNTNTSSNTNSNSTMNVPNSKQQSEAVVETLTDYLVNTMDAASDVDNYGVCFKCNERVMGENSGCTAMDQIYHIACFTCSQCQINLQGKPFYALEGKPYCEYDYLQTLEKCSVCMKPILERILRATGKPYHPQCFTCVVCGKSLDGIPFTVDATNQNYCIADFHKKFAPRCCVCKEPIMPEPGEEETIRVVALDRSFHFECYKCEDCGLLLSSEAEGRGCYPLDDHVLCKSCNAKRVQMLTSRMTTEL